MLPAELMKQVKRIRVLTGRHVADVLAGAYVSVFKGRGMEFDEVRPYVPGDDVRTIDWNVTARSGAPFVKRFVEERELTVVLAVDVSPSMRFGSGARSKLEAAAELSALVAFSAIDGGDKVGLLLFEGAAETFLPPRKGQRHGLRVIREVLARGAEGVETGGAGAASDRASPRAGGADSGSSGVLARLSGFLRSAVRRQKLDARRRTNVGGAVEHIRKAVRRRAVVFVISDFIDDGYLPALRAAARRHDLVAIRVGDVRERTPVDAGGLVTLLDPETGATRVVDTGSAAEREAIAAKEVDRIRRVEADLRASGIDLVHVDAAGDVVAPLVTFFRMRERRGRRS